MPCMGAQVQCSEVSGSGAALRGGAGSCPQACGGYTAGSPPAGLTAIAGVLATKTAPPARAATTRK